MLSGTVRNARPRRWGRWSRVRDRRLGVLLRILLPLFYLTIQAACCYHSQSLQHLQIRFPIHFTFQRRLTIRRARLRILLSHSRITAISHTVHQKRRISNKFLNCIFQHPIMFTAKIPSPRCTLNSSAKTLGKRTLIQSPNQDCSRISITCLQRRILFSTTTST